MSAIVVRAILPLYRNCTVKSKNLSSDLSPLAASLRDSRPNSCLVSTSLFALISLMEDSSFWDLAEMNLGKMTYTAPSRMSMIVFFSLRYGSTTAFPFSQAQIMKVSSSLLA